MKNFKKYSILLSALSLASYAAPPASLVVQKIRGSETGNGGLHVKMRFQEVGHLLEKRFAQGPLGVLKFNAERPWFVPFHGETIPMDSISQVLDEKNILVDSKPLYDKFGSKVAARVDDSLPPTVKVLPLQLDENEWTPQLDNKETMDKMVCHEMMRSLRVNDDNERTCKELLARYPERGDDRTVDNLIDAHQAWLADPTEDILPDNTAVLIHQFIYSKAEPQKQVPMLKDFAEPGDQILDYDRYESGALNLELRNLKIVVPTRVELAIKRAEPSREVPSYVLLFQPKDSVDPVEVECVKKQVAALGVLRDASNAEALAVRFRNAIERKRIEVFNVRFTRYSSQAVSSFKSGKSGKSGKSRKIDIKAEDVALLDHLGVPDLHLEILRNEYNPRDKKRRMVLDIPIADDTCSDLGADQIVKMLEDKLAGSSS